LKVDPIAHVIMALLCKWEKNLLTHSSLFWLNQHVAGISTKRKKNNTWMGTSKLNPGSGLMVMTVLVMTGTFQSLMPKPLMVSNLSPCKKKSCSILQLSWASDACVCWLCPAVLLPSVILDK
jgi:hypothetical protein